MAREALGLNKPHHPGGVPVSDPQPDPWYGEGSISDPTTSGPYVEQTAEPGEAAKGVELVTEEIEDRFWEAAAPGPLAAGDGIGSGEVRRGLIAVAAALVAAAEERGAAKERERLLRIY